MKLQSNSSSYEIRKTIENNWQEYLSKYGNLFRSDSISGSSPPSIFVGSYGYPKVGFGHFFKLINCFFIFMTSEYNASLLCCSLISRAGIPA